MIKIPKLLDVGHRWLGQGVAGARTCSKPKAHAEACSIEDASRNAMLHVQQVTSHASHAGMGAMHEMHTTVSRQRDPGGFQSKPRGIDAWVKK